MKVIFYFLIGLVSIRATHAQDPLQQVVAGRKNLPAQYNKPYVILISADGFRYDYAEKYHAKNLLRLSATGARAKSMIPSFPSVTFPNHYTIATGLYPSHHGLVYNQFYDRHKKNSYTMYDRKAVEDGSWYGGTPLWVLAEKQGMLSAAYYFVGTEADIQGIRPTYWYKFNDTVNISYRIDRIVDWLQLPEDKRPHLITIYFSNADHAGHDFGPDAIQTKEAVLQIDNAIGVLTEKISKLKLPVNFVFVSDHGMAKIDTAAPLSIFPLIDTSLFIVKGGGTSIHLYAKNTKNILPAYNSLKKQSGAYNVYLREEIPVRWHYNKTDDRYDRIGDIFVVPLYPKTFSSKDHGISPGAHGFDPAMKEMHASFYAWGTQIKKCKIIGSFENVHVYPFICSILGLKYTNKIDGNPKVLSGLLR